ncbi:NAD(P)-dependent dehydrogenase, short-chain alcohol dehydrogenase family [Fodinibius roseus]|uniref:NAD(P)-dependent dehydrogenase, short-chain alcohol dehydrogenase family n=1 Tax=Fodinibius roseus TaxID=1194090 RepID=A0A1M5D6W6_9BACT|nr:SDR family oxidoreductase [Fodinibius roseus]SHF62610.1 NAD(P)-dependent dehydrogenase, short-chain alcohol dehydrogenase family [Fodinibius roseus]
MFTADTLEGQTILITGGGSGLGLAMAKKFAALGSNVAICGRTEDKLRRAVREIEGERKGGQVEYYVADVRSYERMEEVLNEIISDFGTMTGLVNNAAGNFLSASEDLSPGGFKAVVDIVLYGSFNCTHLFGNYLIDQGQEGSILNMVTTYSESTGSAFVLPSACGKAGVLAMTRSLAYEWATYGIRLNAIAPGPFPTKGAWKRLIPDERAEEQFLSNIPAGRYGDKEELANLATFLMSDMAPYITGECVVIDGGERLSAGQFNFIDRLGSREELKNFFRGMREKGSE